MIRNIRINNFQSITSANLELGKLTVIVGQTNAGKSAFIRALRTLVFNAQDGASYVTKGKKQLLVEVSNDEGTVSLERGKAHSVYRVGEETYTKSGVAVPEAVTQALRLQALDIDGQRLELNFASQFDKPFLLDEAGTRVAKVLGELTNITVLFEAIREANRRRLGINNELKTRKGDLAVLKEKAQKFVGLKERQYRAAAMTSECNLLKHALGRWDDLSMVLSVLDSLEGNLEDVDKTLEAAPEVDITHIEKEVTDWYSLAGAIQLVQTLDAQDDEARGWLIELDKMIEALDAQFHEKLEEVGICPLCNQQIEGAKV